MKELSKAYPPQEYEDHIYEQWEKSGFFNPDVCVEKGITQADAPAFSIVLPPPNVTGTLHMGHAAMLAIEDVMVRYHRMKGDKTLWLPGTDHAAVATESKVEGILISEGMKKPKEELGREAFLQRVQQFAKESHDTIIAQSKKMGSSLDWSREAYTLDEKRNYAVRTVFKKMYDDGLIYRGYRVINWSVKGQSTCSDDELVYVERPATLYYFKYSKEFPITIATTRPETKLGDSAVAVHPEGKWKQYIGQEFEVHDFGQPGHTLHIKIIADEEIDDNFGTGALGVTAAHSPTDFEMYQKQKALGNDIQLIQIIGEDGHMTANAGSAYVGLTVEQARERLVAYLRDADLLEKEEAIVQNVGTSDRFKDVVEPLPKTQWFIDVNKKFEMHDANIAALNGNLSLKERMQIVVRENHIDIVPERFEKTYFHWIDNLRDWCISRQIWFGHQIPVWYRGEEMVVGVEAPEGEGWTQDPDTLDTWFSSGLWTFSTLGWPKKTDDFQTYHPTAVLETGYDILFFWVARMILMTTYTLGDVPFQTVYLHGLVRDEQGRKMSKSLGNIINPLDMIDQYGTDATRLSLLIGATPGNDVKLSQEKIAGFRNFTNKLWNISRFMLLNIEHPQRHIAMPQVHTDADVWILEKLNILIGDVTAHLDAYEFSLAGEKLREFTWSVLADWYLEMAKVEGQKSEILNYLLNTMLTLWHPFMPFVTEAIWQEVYGESMLMAEPWPTTVSLSENTSTFDLVCDVITAIRAQRADRNIAPARKIIVSIGAGESTALLEKNRAVIEHLSRLEYLTIEKELDPNPVNGFGFVVGNMNLLVHLDGVIDVTAERIRLQKEIDHVAPYVEAQEKKLSGPFAQNAPAEIVEKEKQKLIDAKDTLTLLQRQYNELI